MITDMSCREYIKNRSKQRLIWYTITNLKQYQKIKFFTLERPIIQEII